MIKQIFVITMSVFSLSFANAQELKQIMARTGEVFTKIQRAILVDKNLGAETQAACHDLSFLFQQSKSQVPDLDRITNDPAKRKELLAKYQELMNRILPLSEELEYFVVNQRLIEATELLKKLKGTQKEAHAIFTPETTGGPN